MEALSFPTTAGQLAKLFGARLLGDEEARVDALAPLSGAVEGTLSFYANRKYGADFARAKGAVLFIHEDLVQSDLPVTLLVVPDPQRAFAEVAKGFRAVSFEVGISPQAIIHPTAKLEEGVSVGPFTTIGAETYVGKGTSIHSHVTIGNQIKIGEGCEIHPQVVLWDRIEIGNRVKIFAGSILGSEGFGYIEGESGYQEMPQVGTVVIEEDVRIGALCTVDRATLGETRVGRGTKLDNLVHVGHNCRVGENVILCAQVGLGGSVVVEDGAILGGQVGIGHGVKIGARARMGGQSGSSTNIKGDETYFLTPAVPVREVVKMIRYNRKLPQMWERLKKLEEEVSGE